VHTVVVLPREYEDCGELLSSQHALEKVYNRQMMLQIFVSWHVKAYHCKVMAKKMTLRCLDLQG